MRRGSATTLQDVASEAGVSAMTVSAVLNGGRSATRVSDATRTRVEEIAARLRYRPNAVARGLSRRCMDTLGVVAYVNGTDLNQYFIEILNGILDAATRCGQNTTIFPVADWATDEQKILRFCDGRVDGMIFISPLLTAPFAQTLALHTPFVTVHPVEALPDVHSVTVDNEGGARMMVRHLISQGHRRIAHITGLLNVADGQQRLTGYRRALEDADIPWDESLVFPGNFMIEAGRQGIANLLVRPGPRPTAVFCANDATAYGAVEALAGRGLRVPDDISVGGFDDLLLARMTVPNLTTVRQPFREMGQRAVELLLREIRCGISADDLASAPPKIETMNVNLVVRQSVGPPPV